MSATTNGVFRIFSSPMDSNVCGSSPCMMSTTRMAMSHRPEPRDRRLVKDSWPGVSMTSRPGTRMSNSFFKDALISFVLLRITSAGKYVALERRGGERGGEQRDRTKSSGAVVGRRVGVGGRPDLLCDSACFVLLHIGAADLIQQLRPEGRRRQRTRKWGQSTEGCTARVCARRALHWEGRADFPVSTCPRMQLAAVKQHRGSSSHTIRSQSTGRHCWLVAM